LSSNAPLETADLELALSKAGAGHQLQIRLSRPGDNTDIRRGPYPVTLARETVTALARDPAALGAALGDALFADPAALTAFAEARAAGLGPNRRLRIRLLLTPELQAIPWETLIDPQSRRPLALETVLLLSRYLSADDYQPVTLRPRSTLRALVAVAAPDNLADYPGLAPITAPAEITRAQAALSGISVETLGATNDQCSLAALSDRLRAGAGYDILYLVAHGALKAGTPRLYLADDAGKVAVTNGADLADVLRSLNGRRPRLVTLASCESAGDGFADALAALGPLIAQAGVPAVLAMQGKIAISTVERFAPTFFRELLHDGLADRALAVARLDVRNRPDWWMPVLYSRLTEGRIWAPEAPNATTQRPPRASSGDPLTGYMAALDALKDRLGASHARYDETLVFEQRLRETIKKARLFGDTEQRRAERAEIIAELNSLALATIGVPFNDL
jgi:hypothetical protein